MEIMESSIQTNEGSLRRPIAVCGKNTHLFPDSDKRYNLPSCCKAACSHCSQKLKRIVKLGLNSLKLIETKTFTVWAEVELECAHRQLPTPSQFETWRQYYLNLGTLSTRLMTLGNLFYLWRKDG